MAQLNSFHVVNTTRLEPNFWKSVVEANIQEFGDDLFGEVIPKTGGILTGPLIFDDSQTFLGSQVLIVDPPYDHTGSYLYLSDHIADAAVHLSSGEVVLLQGDLSFAQDGDINISGDLICETLTVLVSGDILDLTVDTLTINVTGDMADGASLYQTIGLNLFKYLASNTGSDITDAMPGNETSVAHGMGVTPVSVMLTPTDLGQIYLSSVSDATNFYVKSDTSSLSFLWESRY